MQISDTLTGKKTEFKPFGETVTMYVCGITPYDDSHLGHAMSAIVFDVVRRYLRFRGYQLKTVQNITDVDDKIINRANRLGINAAELASKYANSYREEMELLNVSPPDFNPKATEEIPSMLKVIQGLIDKGFAYAANGSVYFRVKNKPDYGKLSKRKFDTMIVGASIEPGEEKEDPLDFALWKAAKPNEPQWDSPWGKGRPGWHIECSAMSTRYLGEQIDIHGGGSDLVFPHHENEIAQTESFTGKVPFVKYWMHNGSLQLGAEKMSKSLGNLITIREFLKKYSADALRIFVLSSYYRSPLTYTDEAVEAAQNGAERLQRTTNKESAVIKGKALIPGPYYDRFIEAMDDDFNTSQAIAVLFDLASAINQAVDSGENIVEAQNTLITLGRKILGLKLPRIINVSVSDGVKLKATVEAQMIPAMINTLVNSLINERVNCRKEKKWQRADEIRDKLTELGVILEDSQSGTTATYKHPPSEKELLDLVKELGLNF
jgi:cysteinyl-tRNA synthetase